MNGNLARVVVIGSGVVIAVSSTWIASVMSYGERIAKVETSVQYIEKQVDRLVDSLL